MSRPHRITPTIGKVLTTELKDPIKDALRRYSHDSDGCLAFDYQAAARLTMTREKPYSAHSQSEVRLGEKALDLTVVAFNAWDGTGDDSTLALDDINPGIYPKAPKILPRDKSQVEAEVHLALVSCLTDFRGRDMHLFAGHLDLLGISGQDLVKLGSLGQPLTEFEQCLQGHHQPAPRATYTVGHKPSGERLGDPHAVFNSRPQTVQVCGFIALGREHSAEQRRIIELLNPTWPQ